MMRCLEKRKHCLSPSFFREREPSRPLVILPFSLIGTCISEPVRETVSIKLQGSNIYNIRNKLCCSHVKVWEVLNKSVNYAGIKQCKQNVVLVDNKTLHMNIWAVVLQSAYFCFSFNFVSIIKSTVSKRKLWSVYSFKRAILLTLITHFKYNYYLPFLVSEINIPCLTNVWLVSSSTSQPSTIIRSIARFFLMFSVSLTSSCMILKVQKALVNRVYTDLKSNKAITGCSGKETMCVCYWQTGSAALLKENICVYLNLYFILADYLATNL